MKANFAAVLSLSILGSWLASTPWAVAQQPLERLEGQIRSQSAPGEPVGPKVRATGERPYLGAVADDKTDRGRGVRVLTVRPGGPAEQAGLRPQDLITGAASTRVRQMSDLTAVLELFSPGDKVPLELIRDGQPQRVDVTLGRFPGAAETTPAPPGAIPSTPAVPGPGTFITVPADGPNPPPGALIAAPTSDSARIEQLLRRIEQLEQRVQELEKAVSDSRKKQ